MSHKDFSLRQKKEKHDIKKAKTCIPVFEDNFVHLIFAAVKSVAMDYAKRSTRTTPRCLECGKSLGYGRSDRKYCSDGCRNSHHNHLARSGRNIRRRVMTILERNYQILDAVVKSGVQAVWLSDLMAAGFNPGYATSFRRSRHKEEYTCFDIRYVMTPGRLSSISKIQNLSLNLQAGPDEGHV